MDISPSLQHREVKENDNRTIRKRSKRIQKSD